MPKIYETSQYFVACKCKSTYMTRGIFLILHNIRSLHNVGSIFRTADAFGVAKIYLCGYTGSPYDRLGKPVKEVAKTALGAERTVPWERVQHTWRVMDMLNRQGVHVVALENNVRGAVSLQKFKPRFPLALLVGNEIRGISRALLCRADAIVAIPMRGKKESLNVSVACGVALWAMHGVCV